MDENNGYIIHLRSNDATKNNNSTSDITFDLENKRITRKLRYFKVSLINLMIPYCWENVNSRNNKFYYTEYSDLIGSGATTLTITITNGNYNINDLCSYIQTELNSNTVYSIVYSVSYDNITNKVTFSITNVDKSVLLNFAGSYSIYKFLGFSKTTYNLTYLNHVTSVNIINSYLDNAIYIRTNIINNNSYDSKTKDKSNILQKIDIIVDFNEYISLTNKITPVLSTDDNIQKIQLQVTDDEGNIIDLKNQEWTCTLEIMETDNTNYLSDIKTLLWILLNLKSENKKPDINI